MTSIGVSTFRKGEDQALGGTMAWVWAIAVTFAVFLFLILSFVMRDTYPPGA
jgi:hypothetical protein